MTFERTLFQDKQQFLFHINKIDNHYIKNFWEQVILKMKDVLIPTLMDKQFEHISYSWLSKGVHLRIDFNSFGWTDWISNTHYRMFDFQKPGSIDDFVSLLEILIVESVMEV